MNKIYLELLSEILTPPQQIEYAIQCFKFGFNWENENV